MHRSLAVGERGFEPPTSASRTLRANRAAPLPERRNDTTPGVPRQCAVIGARLLASVGRMPVADARRYAQEATGAAILC